MLEFALSRECRSFVCCDVKVFGGQKTTWLVVEVGMSWMPVGRIYVCVVFKIEKIVRTGETLEEMKCGWSQTSVLTMK